MYDDDDYVTMGDMGVCLLALLAIIFFLWFLCRFVFDDKLAELAEEGMKRAEEESQALSAYFEQHHCEHVGHISLSRGDHARGCIFRQYKCDNGLFLDYEIKDHVRTALRNKMRNKN